MRRRVSRSAATETRLRAPARSVAGLPGLALDVRVDPRDHEIGELVAVSVLHQHVAVAFDAERGQMHHLRIAARLLELVDERVARLEGLLPAHRAARHVAE